MAPRRLSLSPAILATLLVLTGCAAKPSPPTAAANPLPAASASAARAADAPRPKESTEKLVRNGRAAYNSGDFNTASRAFEQVLGAEPANRQALWHLALMAERQAAELPRPRSSPYYLLAAAELRKLRAAYPELTPQERAELPGIFYKEAATLSLDGESARALGALSESIAAGFVDIARIEADPELDSLRGLPEFQLLFGRLERWLTLFLFASSKPFPFSFALKDLDDKPVALADFKGKVLIVVFWGTWCLPARKEVPHLIELYKRYHSQGLEVVGLGDEIEQGESARKVVRAFARSAGIPYPCLIGDEVTRNLVPGFAGYPTTLFIDRAGKVRLGLSGYQPLSTLETAAAALLGEGQATKTNGKEKGKAKEKEQGS